MRPEGNSQTGIGKHLQKMQPNTVQPTLHGEQVRSPLPLPCPQSRANDPLGRRLHQRTRPNFFGVQQLGVGDPNERNTCSTRIWTARLFWRGQKHNGVGVKEGVTLLQAKHGAHARQSATAVTIFTSCNHCFSVTTPWLSLKLTGDRRHDQARDFAAQEFN